MQGVMKRKTGEFETLLIVDDNPVNLSVVVDHLEAQNYRVLVALDGEEALERAAYCHPDLILLDVMMPGIDGFETCRRLKARSTTSDIPVIFMTALDDVADKVAAFNAGGVDYISKPFQLDELMARVRTHLDLRAALAGLRASELSFRRLFETADDGILLVDPEAGTVIDVNARMLALVGHPRAQVVGCHLSRVSEVCGHDGYAAAKASLARDGVFKTDEWLLRRPDGVSVAVEVTASLCDIGGRTLAQWNFRDVSDRRAAEARIRHLALHDALTGLPNRTMFFDRMAMALANARRSSTAVAALVIDLDHFKGINDTLGHIAGDRLLEAVAARLIGCLRETDTAARVGGDEFMAALSDIGSRESAERVAREILAALAEPYVIDGKTMRISASIGISLYPEDGSDGPTLVRAADTAMYGAKKSGRGTCRLFTPNLSMASERWHILSHDLNGACERGEFVLHYQPQIALQSREIIGLETLLRWNHPTEGLIQPELFIPQLEERGLMAEVGRWVLDSACRQNAQWQAEGLPPVRIAVNLSAQQFYRDDIVRTVATVLAASGLDAKWLELELTESLTLDDTEATLRIMANLKAIGVALSLDDFGTGWSSLAYLRRFPLDRIKIDRSFVRDLVHHEGTAAIVHSIIDLARRLGMDCIAEGVETEEQRDLLLQELCPGMQGFLFSEAVPADRMPDIFRSKRMEDGRLAGSPENPVEQAA